MDNRKITRTEFDKLSLDELCERARKSNDDNLVKVLTRDGLVDEAIESLKDRDFGTATNISALLLDDFHNYYTFDGTDMQKPITTKSDIEWIFNITECSCEEITRVITILENALDMLIDRDIEDDNLIAEAKQTYLEKLGTSAEELAHFGIDWENM